MRTFTFIIFILAAMSANAQILNVPGTYPTIQAGINAAQPGDTVLVAEGTYYEQISFTGKAITVASNYIIDGDPGHIDGTILDGSQLPAGNGSIVLFTSGEDTTSILQGFTVLNGSGTNVGQLYKVGGGIFINGSGASILNNKITNNIVRGFATRCVLGGGIGAPYLAADDKWIVICNNEISGNQSLSDLYDAGGAAIFSCNNTRMVGNTITGNSCINTAGRSFAVIFIESLAEPPQGRLIAENNIINNNSAIVYNSEARGGGMWCAQLDAVIVNNEFSNNTIDSATYTYGGAAIHIKNPVTTLIKGNQFNNNLATNSGGALYVITGNYSIEPVVIEENIFTGNQANSGGAIYSTLQLILRNNLFEANISTGEGGAIRLLDIIENLSTFENNTFTANSAVSGGAIYNDNSELQLINNVFERNLALAEEGGAIALFKPGFPYTNTHLVNNAFSGNKSPTKGGAIYSYACNPMIINTIFFNDSALTGEEIGTENGDVSVAFSNLDTTKIKGQVNLLDGIMFCDPAFCDTACLKPHNYSECLNAGIGEYIFEGVEGPDTLVAPSYDILNQPRPLENKYDMGAYELLYVGVKDPDAGTAFSLFPNPFTTNPECSYKLQSEAQVTITLYNLKGVVIQSWQFTQPAGDHTKTLELKNLSKGVYLLELKINGTPGSRKAVKI